MPGIADRLETFLEDQQVDYEVLLHPRDVTAREVAADTHTPESQFAKAVLLWVDGRIVMAVIPADMTAAFSRIREELLARKVRLASETETGKFFPDCELGAEPPFGNLYDLPVYVSRSLTRNEEIIFNGGSHDHAIRMSYADYERIVQPRCIAISHHD
jgi:Ala-tRNA(Pro) deacylase